MTDLIVEISKYLMTFLFALYAYECFSSFRGKLSDEKRQRISDVSDSSGRLSCDLRSDG